MATPSGRHAEPPNTRRRTATVAPPRPNHAAFRRFVSGPHDVYCGNSEPGARNGCDRMSNGSTTIATSPPRVAPTSNAVASSEY